MWNAITHPHTRIHRSRVRVHLRNAASLGRHESGWQHNNAGFPNQVGRQEPRGLSMGREDLSNPSSRNEQCFCQRSFRRQRDVVLGTRTLATAEVGAIGAGMLASAYLGFVIGACAYASLRLRGYDLAGEGTALTDFYSWQQSNSPTTFFDWWSGAFGTDQEIADKRLKIETRKARVIQALNSSESRKKIKVAGPVYSCIRSL